MHYTFIDHSSWSVNTRLQSFSQNHYDWLGKVGDFKDDRSLGGGGRKMTSIIPFCVQGGGEGVKKGLKIAVVLKESLQDIRAVW